MQASMTSHHRQSIVLDSANDVSDVAVLDYDGGIVGLKTVVFSDVVVNPNASGQSLRN